MAGVFLVFFGGLGMAIWSIVLCVQLIFAKSFSSAFLIAALSLIIPFGFLRMFWFWQDQVDIAHFRFVRPQYDAVVAGLRPPGARYEEFNWGGMLFASRGITYDETDQLRLPPDKQSAAFRARMKNTDLYCGGDAPVGEVRPLGDHYYLTTFGC